MTVRERPLRADAARNRDKLLHAARAVLGEQGLDAPLEAVARRAGVSIAPGSADPAASCAGFSHIDRIIGRAKDAGGLRADYTAHDLTTLVWAVSRIIQLTADTDPSAWRRFLALHLDGLRSHPA